jgi:hypothetical protein
MTPRFYILASAFCGFCICALLVLALGFRNMEAGYLDLLTVLAIVIPVLAIRQFMEDFYVVDDEEIDDSFNY